MQSRYLSSIGVITILVLAHLLDPSYAPAQKPAPLSKETLAAVLEHQEALARTVEATFEIIKMPTKEEMVPLIRQFCKLQGDEKETRSYVYTEELARRLSERISWLRKGSKERLEITPLSGAKGGTTIAFDGNLVRSRACQADRSLGQISTAEQGHWTNANRVHPFSLVYYYINTPYSELIRGAPNFTSRSIVRDGKPYTEVRLGPVRKTISFSMLFDDNRRLVERQVYVWSKTDKQARLREKHVLTDYRAHPDPSGETICFPHHADYTYCLGHLPSGALVEYGREAIEIKDIRFNVDIPDDKFVLDFPAEMPVFDSVTGAGLINPGDDVPYSQRTGKKWMRIILVVVSVAILGAVILAIVRRRLRNAAP